MDIIPVDQLEAEEPEKEKRKYVASDIVKRLQGVAMMRDIATKGMKVSEVARKYGVSPDTVARRLSYADRAGLFTKHEDTILEGMVPLSEKIILKHLQQQVEKQERGEEGDIQTALDIYKGTGLFRKPGTRAPAADQGDGDESLAAHIQKLRERAALEQNTVDADILPAHAVALLAAHQGDPGLALASPRGDDGSGEARAEEAHRAGSPGADGASPAPSLPGTGAAHPQVGSDDPLH